MAIVKFYDAMGVGANMLNPDLAYVANDGTITVDGDPYSSWYDQDTIAVTYSYNSGSFYETLFISEISDPYYLIESWYYADESLSPLADFYGINIQFNINDDFSSGAVFSNMFAGDDTIEGNNYSDNLRSGSGRDLVFGLGGTDSLDGGVGGDTMVGGSGNDTYIVDNIGDRIAELSGQGIDLVKSSISYSLLDTDGAGASGGNVEKLTLTGTNAINGTGNSLLNTLSGNIAANTLKGLAGKDTLVGNGGNDTLYGGTGNDALTGGLGADRFVFDTTPNVTSNLDTVKDFVVGTDKIVLDDDFYSLGLTGTSTGVALTANKFQLGLAANDPDDRIIYGHGKLYYDADGSGAGAQVQFALVATGTTLSASDFLVIS